PGITAPIRFTVTRAASTNTSSSNPIATPRGTRDRSRRATTGRQMYASSPPTATGTIRLRSPHTRYAPRTTPTAAARDLKTVPARLEVWVSITDRPPDDSLTP